MLQTDLFSVSASRRRLLEFELLLKAKREYDARNRLSDELSECDELEECCEESSRAYKVIDAASVENKIESQTQLSYSWGDSSAR